MSLFARFQMNTVGPELRCPTQSHRADTFKEGSGRDAAVTFRDQLKTHIQIDLKEKQSGVLSQRSAALPLQLHSLTGSLQLFLTLTNNPNSEK